MANTTNFCLKAGDRYPFLDAILRNGDGTPRDLTGATVVFRWKTIKRNRDFQPLVSLEGICQILGLPTLGNVRYSWAEGDTTTPGSYLGDFNATFADGKSMSFPECSYINFEIL